MQSEGIINSISSINDEVYLTIMLKPDFDNWDWQLGERVQIFRERKRQISSKKMI